MIISVEYKGLVNFLHRPKIEQFWFHIAEGLSRYFRIEVEGLENIPDSGPAMIAPNHSGYAGADAVVLSHLISSRLKRAPKILAHRAYFESFRLIKEVSQSFGLEKASIQGGIRILQEGKLLLIFPEAETGNFKPSCERYHLQPFHTGFVRLSLETQAPIIPTLVIGAEESHVNLGQLDFSSWVKGLRVPLPLNLLPLPAKWKVIFLKPIRLNEGKLSPSSDFASVLSTTKRIRRKMQDRLRVELAKRPYVYFDSTAH
ncbi:MAG: 1-acyl-sn-glycerol-3-phosphate acyltransferase [Bdellovibrionia bacterium]